MDKNKTLHVFGAAYDNVADAMKDFAQLQELHRDDKLGGYDAAIMTKEESGQVLVSNLDTTGHFKGAAKGAVVGAVLGAIFVPAAVGVAAIGAAAGAAIPKRKHLGRLDFKEIGELLMPGESGILLVADEISDSAAAAIMPNARRKKSIEVAGDAEAIKNAINEEARLSLLEVGGLEKLENDAL